MNDGSDGSRQWRDCIINAHGTGSHNMTVTVSRVTETAGVIITVPSETTRVGEVIHTVVGMVVVGMEASSRGREGEYMGMGIVVLNDAKIWGIFK